MQYLEPAEFISHLPMIDVRAPGEFSEGHIVGATNIPLFSDDERAEVGTLYKQVGREAAIDKGFEIVGPKMKTLAQQVRALADVKPVAVYCWRGGMRSKHMATLFEMADVECVVLEGGYKAFRSYAQEQFSAMAGLTVLAGPTGSGKTDILAALAERGEQMIDLEGLAHHRGSAFGAIGKPPQPTTEHFQNLVFDALRSFDLSQRIWIESESKSIGHVYLPEALWRRMNESPIVTIAVQMEVRVQRIVAEYGQLPASELAASVERITRRLGDETAKSCITLIEEGEFAQATEMLLGYYDRGYLNSRNKHKTITAQEITLSGDDVGQWADQLLAEV